MIRFAAIVISPDVTRLEVRENAALQEQAARV
jgi:hypothetical protein